MTADFVEDYFMGDETCKIATQTSGEVDEAKKRLEELLQRVELLESACYKEDYDDDDDDDDDDDGDDDDDDDDDEEHIDNAEHRPLTWGKQLEIDYFNQIGEEELRVILSKDLTKPECSCKSEHCQTEEHGNWLDKMD